MNFHLGQKLVCVDDEPRQGWSRSDYGGLRKNAIYTIRDFAKDAEGRESCRLEEIHRDVMWCGIKDYPFLLKRFRPVTEKKTDISIFTAMLNPSDRKVAETVR